MSGLLALVGAGEYLPSMAETDRHLLSLAAPGRVPRVVCLPTAAGAEGRPRWERWNYLGAAHFERLGAEVWPLPVIDAASANLPSHAEPVANADLIYFSGGQPHYLEAVLRGSAVWEAVLHAYARGAILVGCSAGAMVMGEWLMQFGSGFHPAGWSAGLGLIPHTLVVPHFDYRGFNINLSVGPLRQRLPGEITIIGIDEHTALVGRPGEPWEVHGRSTVTRIGATDRDSAQSGESIPWWGHG